MPTQCKTCNQQLADDLFYTSASGRSYRRCKECMRKDREATALYNKYALKPFSEWPENLQELASWYQQVSTEGGKIDYSGSVATELVSRYETAMQIQVDSAQVDEVMVTLSNRISKVEKQLTAICSVLKSNLKANAKAVKSMRNLLEKIVTDPELIAVVGGEQEAEHFCDKLREAVRCINTCGYVEGTTLRAIIVEFESVEAAVPESVLEFYYQYLKPGIEATMYEDTYAEHVNICESLLGYNPYEVDWKSLPLTSD